MVWKLVAVALAVLCVVLIIAVDSHDYNKHIRNLKRILSEGNTIVYYLCRNNEFNDYVEIARYTVIEGGDEWFKYTDGKDVLYEKYSIFGRYDDKVEVYEGDRLIYTAGFEL